VIDWRELSLEPLEQEVAIRGRYRIRADTPGWIDVQLAGPGVQLKSARLDGRPAAVSTSEEGTALTAWLNRDTELTFTGAVTGDASRGPVAMEILGAPRGEVHVLTAQHAFLTSTEAVAEVSGAFWTGANDLSLRIADSEPIGPKPDLVIGQVGMGATLFDNELLVKAHLRWGIVQGSRDEVSFSVSGAGSDLQVEGSQMAEWIRTGDRVTVRLREPEESVVDIDLSWSTPIPGGDETRIPVPQIQPLNTFRTERSLQLSRDGEVEMLPDLSSWTPASRGALPDWGRGLVEGTPTAAYTKTGGSTGAIRLFRFSPVSGPPTFVDVAAYDIATTAAGRSLIRAKYQIRNERGAFLRLVPPPDTRILGAMVSGEAASVASDGQAWLIPLEKSVETVDGLLSFSVEVSLLGAASAWETRETRTVKLPRVNAPVAVTRTTIYLPPSFRSQLEVGEAGTVDAFTEGEGISYGSALGDLQSTEADALFQEAVTAWMSNDFDAVQDNLDALDDMNAENTNIERLQANMDLISGKKDTSASGGAVALERRVKEQAKARATRDREAQEQVLEEAEGAYLSGDYKQAEQAYTEALKLGKMLEKLEQEESVEIAEANAMLTTQLEGAKKKAKKHVEEDSIDLPILFGVDEAPVPDVASGTSLPADRGESDEVAPPRGEPNETVAAFEADPVATATRAAGVVQRKGFLRGRPNAEPASPKPHRQVTSDEAPVVRATTLGVVIPVNGEAVRYQHLLLEANAAFALQIQAKKSRRP